MPKLQDSSPRDFSQYDSWSTPDLRKILLEDASKEEGEESDTELVLYVMRLLTERESRERKTPKEAWRSFKEQYDTEQVFISEEKQNSRKSSIGKPWVRRLAAAAAAVAIVIVGGMLTAKALRFDLGKYLAVWTQETFRFSKQSSTTEDDTQNVGDYSAMKIPTWVPEGFERQTLVHKETLARQELYISYKRGNDFLAILAVTYQEDAPLLYQQSDGLIEIYTANGVDYYLFRNNRLLNAACIIDGYELSVAGDVTIEEMKKIIDSVK